MRFGRSLILAFSLNTGCLSERGTSCTTWSPSSLLSLLPCSAGGGSSAVHGGEFVFTCPAATVLSSSRSARLFEHTALCFSGRVKAEEPVCKLRGSFLLCARLPHPLGRRGWKLKHPVITSCTCVVLRVAAFLPCGLTAACLAHHKPQDRNWCVSEWNEPSLLPQQHEMNSSLHQSFCQTLVFHFVKC